VTHVRIGPRDILVLEPLDFGPPPEWWYPHEPEPEVRHYMNGPDPRRTVRPCYCPLPAEHPIHGGER
jgi:hypothetical protein